MTLEILLVVLVFFPLAGSFLALATGHKPLLCRWVSLCVTFIELSLVCLLFFAGLKPQVGPSGAWLLMVDYPWLEGLGARFSLGLDGLSLMLIALTAFVNVICILISWQAITVKVGPFHFFLLFLEGCLMGWYELLQGRLFAKQQQSCDFHGSHLVVGFDDTQRFCQFHV